MSGVVLQRLGLPGREIPVVRGEDGFARDLRPLTSDIDGDFLAADGPARRVVPSTPSCPSRAPTR